MGSHVTLWPIPASRWPGFRVAPTCSSACSTAAVPSRPPGNALVLRADGSLDHALSPSPQVVPNPVNLDETLPLFSASGPGSRLCGESFTAGRSLAAEGFGTVGCHEGQLFADIIFHYELRERRLYDPERRLWGPRLGIHRE